MTKFDIASSQDGWSDLSDVARRVKAEAIPINCGSCLDGFRKRLNPSCVLATKQSSLLQKDGLLRGACHRARIRATRWLAMTLMDSRSP
jgi:hypothetical protein